MAQEIDGILYVPASPCGHTLANQAGERVEFSVKDGMLHIQVVYDGALVYFDCELVAVIRMREFLDCWDG